MCKALKFPRSTYYKALICEPSNKRKEHQEFSEKVKQCFDSSKGRYGAVKICKKLNDSGVLCSIKRVQRHMQSQGLRSVVTKRYNHKSNYGNIPSDKENILNRDFETSHMNIWSERGIRNRQIRSIQTEGHFGDIKENEDFRRFNYRSKDKAYKEFMLFAIGRNINKYHRFLSAKPKKFEGKLLEKTA